MNSTRFATVLVALLVVLAGCAGGSGTLTDSPSSSDDGTATGDQAAQTGTLNFYVSDEQNAIADFEHLNVTIERVTLVRANDDTESDDNAEVDAESEADAEAEASAEADSDADNESTNDSTTTASSNMTATATPVLTANGSANASADASVNSTTTTESADAAENESAEADGDVEAESEDDEAGEGGKVTYEVDNVTVDLTELQGDKASLVGTYDVPEGNYTKVFVHVSEVNGTLKTGEQVNVKLPSEKLHLNSNFEVGNGEDVDFVFDITAFKAGKSGKYILKPVVSESGTNVPIEDVGAENAESAGEDGADAEQSDVEVTLNASFDGNVTAGENATLVVTQNETPVENATVSVNGEVVGTTDADGELVVSIPDADEVTVKVTDGDTEAELEYEFGEDEENKPDSAGKSGDTDA
ncbi:DUF4382 domain-containing protein [Haloferax sp. S1W]|uniref:DUF4382 domain-containing protein n=1 Tax=Haloferax sp. S1W TaxID=3377110 RepID=UPI0037C931E4